MTLKNTKIENNETLLSFPENDLITDDILRSLNFENRMIESRIEGGHSVEFSRDKTLLNSFDIFKRYHSGLPCDGYDTRSMGTIFTMEQLYQLTKIFFGKELFLIYKH
jgi:hypothetical protein